GDTGVEGHGEIDVGDRAGEVVAGELRHERRLVHVGEVREVHAVLQHVLRVQFQALPVKSRGGERRVVVGGGAVVAEGGEDVRDLEKGRAAVAVEPDPHRLVAL